MYQLGWDEKCKANASIVSHVTDRRSLTLEMLDAFWTTASAIRILSRPIDETNGFVILPLLRGKYCVRLVFVELLKMTVVERKHVYVSADIESNTFSRRMTGGSVVPNLHDIQIRIKLPLLSCITCLFAFLSHILR